VKALLNPNWAYWLGASDEGQIGTWKWVDGTPMTFAV
jgi:hypothetical protein